MVEYGNGRRHTRDDVARAALHILDEHGLPDLTMRRLASALDVQPSALYWHFANKQTLLAELADRIVAGQSASPGAVRGSHAHAAAHSLRDALLAYRDGAEVVLSTLALGVGAAGAHDRLVTALEADGVEPSKARRAALVLLHFIIGHVLHEQQRMHYDSVGVTAPSAALTPEHGSTAEADFAFGVDLFAAGVERRLVPPPREVS